MHYEPLQIVIKKSNGDLCQVGDLVKIVSEVLLDGYVYKKCCQIGYIDKIFVGSIRRNSFDDSDPCAMIRLSYEMFTDEELLTDYINIEVDKIIQIDLLNHK